MENLFTAVVEGYTKEQALENVELEIVRNATTAWKNAGEPTFGSDKFKVFAENFMAKHKMTTGSGAYIVKESGVKDTRQRPYTIVNYKQEGKAKYTTVYNIYENLGKDEKGGIIYGELIDVTEFLEAGEEVDTKAIAIRIMKELTAETKASYALKKEKVNASEDLNPGLIAECIYTPSTSAKKGEYYVFGIQR